METNESYSEDKLIAAYCFMINQRGKATDEMLTAIQSRGDISNFLEKIELKEAIIQEYSRITIEVQSLASSGTTDIKMIKKLIVSEILSEAELDEVINESIQSYQDKLVNLKTVLTCIAAGLLAIVVGSGIWALSIYFLNYFSYFSIAIIYLVSYIIIKFITKQSRSNPVVFLVSICSTFFSFVFGRYFADLISLI